LPDSTMMRGIVAALILATAYGAIELNEKNFDDEVFASGKAAFIKFLAPW